MGMRDGERATHQEGCAGSSGMPMEEVSSVRRITLYPIAELVSEHYLRPLEMSDSCMRKSDKCFEQASQNVRKVNIT